VRLSTMAFLSFRARFNTSKQRWEDSSKRFLPLDLCIGRAIAFVQRD
jgi:hypothetical protein